MWANEKMAKSAGAGSGAGLAAGAKSTNMLLAAVVMAALLALGVLAAPGQAQAATDELVAAGTVKVAADSGAAAASAPVLETQAEGIQLAATKSSAVNKLAKKDAKLIVEAAGATEGTAKQKLKLMP